MKVLVTAASKHGSTTEIAGAIAAALNGAGHTATILPPEEVLDLDPYDAVVLGSAVYMGQWLGPAKAFAERNHDALASRPTWLFSSGPLGNPPKPDDPLVGVTALAESIGARDHRVFRGQLVKSRLRFVEKAMVAGVKAPEGDFRTWEEIRIWAGSIAASLATAGATAA